MNYITTIKIEKLAHKEDGVIVEYADPVPCDCCGKLCTVKLHHLSTGARVGQDCAFVIERISSDTFFCSKGVVNEAYAISLLRANKKQIRYLKSIGYLN